MTAKMDIITDDVSIDDLSDLFCVNHRYFYLHIVENAASDGESDDNIDKPLRYHRINGIIDCVYSPKKIWSFYNTIMDKDIYQTFQQHHAIDQIDAVMNRFISLSTSYQCPMRAVVNPNATQTIQLLERYGFFELPSKPGVYQYIDLHDVNNSWPMAPIDPEIKVYELDDSTQINCQQRKAEWGYVLSESFCFSARNEYGPFFSKIWSQVTVGPTQPIRMIVAVIGDRVVGGAHVSLAAGIACLFNVSTVRDQRGRGIGKALSLASLECAKNAGYRYMVLQASDMGSVIYKKFGFKPLPGQITFLKIGTIAWYYRLVEPFVRLVGLRRLQQWQKTIQKLSKKSLFTGLIVIIVLGLIFFNFSRH